jgi:hypothetical protein
MENRKFWLTATLVWGMAVTGLALAGAYRHLPGPLFGILVGAQIAALLALYAVSPSLRATFDGSSLRALTAFHIWRIPAGLAFLWAGETEFLPAAFAARAGWGDLAVGVAAAIVLALPERRWLYAAFHIFGMADFVLAVGTGLAFTFAEVPLMANIATFPFAIIPQFGVVLTGALSTLTLLRLARGPAPEPVR